MLIGIIGGGFVGKSMKLLKCKDIEIIIYDIKKELCYPENINIRARWKIEGIKIRF